MWCHDSSGSGAGTRRSLKVSGVIVTTSAALGAPDSVVVFVRRRSASRFGGGPGIPGISASYGCWGRRSFPSTRQQHTSAARPDPDGSPGLDVPSAAASASCPRPREEGVVVLGHGDHVDLDPEHRATTTDGEELRV